jgi:transcriptional regulator with XRE-family HTH domain
MGERLRVERRRQGLSLRELAARVGISPSLISQVETGRAAPSVRTLYTLARELSVSLDDLLFTPRPASSLPERRRSHALDGMPATSTTAVPSPLQRADSRKHIRLASGVVWERLTTISEAGVEFLYVTYEPGGTSSTDDTYQRHAGHEWGYVITGTLSVTIAFEEYQLGPGDAISIDSMVPHRLVNRGRDPVHGIWLVLGRQGSFEHPVPSPASEPTGWHGPLHGGD